MASWFDQRAAAAFPAVAAAVGESAVFTRAVYPNAQETVSVILFDGDEEAARNEGPQSLMVRLADFTVAPVAGDTVAVGGSNYRIVGPPSPDGHGHATLKIRRVL